jgi:hypothetical protein
MLARTEVSYGHMWGTVFDSMRNNPVDDGPVYTEAQQREWNINEKSETLLQL